MSALRLGSVCSGIGGAELAFSGIAEHAFAADIDPFARAVLTHRFPTLHLHGDFTRVSNEPVDILVGGTPCQSFSIAGLRGGMADDRGNLALEFLRLAGRCGARWVLWENVPGVLSSSGGRDFGAFLGGLAELGYGWAYRILDAQFFGLAQRRKRVFVVGYCGDWRRAASVLFEPRSLRWSPSPHGEGWNSAAMLSARGFGEGESRSLIHYSFNWQSGGDCRGLVLGPTTMALTSQQTPAILLPSRAVRRLTPLECERLQGFPDGWTDVPYRGKAASDGPRYRALGNAFAVPVVRWIARRLVREDAQVSASAAA